jgi:hypothetical protein
MGTAIYGLDVLNASAIIWQKAHRRLRVAAISGWILSFGDYTNIVDLWQELDMLHNRQKESNHAVYPFML